MHKITQNYLRIKYFFTLLIAILIACASLMTASFFDKERLVKSDYSGGWVTSTGKLVDINSINTTDHGGRVVLCNTLPKIINYGDALCFISDNSRFSVYVDNELMYEYDQKPNLTGNGYGMAYHTVALRPDQAGKVVKIDLDSVFADHNWGRLHKVSVENAVEYRSRIAKGQLLPFNLSVGIIVMGFVLLFLRVVLPYDGSGPDLVAFGINAIITGIWLANDTGFLRLTMEAVRIGRVTDYVCMHIWILPLLVFIYSVTRERRRIYLALSYLLTLIDIAAFLLFRYVCGFEPANMEWQLILYYLLAVALIAAMLISDSKYCKANSIVQGHRLFDIGLAALFISASVDILIYLSGVRSVSGRGGFARIGFIAFYVIMAIDASRSQQTE